MFKHILVPVDGSATSMQAVGKAAGLAKAFGSEVTAVYVLSDGRLSLRQVRLGDAAGDQVDVISGLKPGDRVAADPVAAQQALVAARKDD